MNQTNARSANKFASEAWRLAGKKIAKSLPYGRDFAIYDDRNTNKNNNIVKKSTKKASK